MSRRTILAAGVVCGLCACAHAGPLQVAVTLTDLTPLVQAVGGDAVVARCVVPAGGDPHSFTLSADTAAALQHADLVVFAGTPFLEFEAEIKRSVPGKPSCDWADYEARGARLSDVPGIAQNPHGFWLHLDNAAAIARAVADRILELRPGAGQVRPNLMSLEHELRTCRQVGRELVAQTGGGLGLPSCREWPTASSILTCPWGWFCCQPRAPVLPAPATSTKPSGVCEAASGRAWSVLAARVGPSPLRSPNRLPAMPTAEWCT